MYKYMTPTEQGSVFTSLCLTAIQSVAMYIPALYCLQVHAYAPIIRLIRWGEWILRSLPTRLGQITSTTTTSVLSLANT